MVGTDGYAPSTFPMSMEYSTIELSSLHHRSILFYSNKRFKINFFNLSRLK